MKLGMVNYIRKHTTHDNFGEGSATWVIWANMCFFFSARSGRICCPIDAIYMPKCVLPATDVPFVVPQYQITFMGQETRRKKSPI